MKEYQVICDMVPNTWDIGQTYALCYTNITEIQVPGSTDEESSVTKYSATAYFMTPTEYSAICNGTYNGEYNEEFRRKERETLLTQADKMKEKANDYIVAGIEKTKWQNYLKELVNYKIAVRETVNQPDFPLYVTYPTSPPST